MGDPKARCVKVESEMERISPLSHKTGVPTSPPMAAEENTETCSDE